MATSRPATRGREAGLTLALPLRGMKAKVEYHTLTSPGKPPDENVRIKIPYDGGFSHQ